MGLSEETKRAPPAPVWNQSFPSPKVLFVRDTFFIRCYPLVPLSRAFPYPQPGDAGGRRSAPADLVL